MEGRPQDYARIGVVHSMLYKGAIGGEGDVARSLAAILADSYLDAVEVTPVRDRAVRDDVTAMLRESRKTVAFAAQPVLLTQGLDLHHSDRWKRRDAVDAIKRVIEQAYEMGAGSCVVLSGRDPGDAGRDTARALLVESLTDIAAELRTQGDVPLVLEIFDRQPFGKNCLIGPTPEAADIARRMRERFANFGLLLDLSHIPLLGESSDQAVANVRDYLVQAHIGNCILRDPEHPLYGDNHPPFRDPDGEVGEEQLAVFLKALLDVGFLDRQKRPILSFEVAPYGQWAPESLLRQSEEVLEAAWARIEP
ncbi:sugar phosphate isomerase/epimerase [Candidatus Sumerlaeota bacterium]|nr:sugar phosphate isomerase/epimerase [Candidatus Sumerlaeota bacterium]